VRNSPAHLTRKTRPWHKILSERHVRLKHRHRSRATSQTDTIDYGVTDIFGNTTTSTRLVIIEVNYIHIMSRRKRHHRAHAGAPKSGPRMAGPRVGPIPSHGGEKRATGRRSQR
jgi:hypothetical protein